MLQRPERLWDQYQGKAMAEIYRGSGWWPLQPHPCALEPPWEPFDRKRVTDWDHIVNGWEGPWEGSWLKRVFSNDSAAENPGLLPEVPSLSWEGLVPIVVEQFPEDEITIPKAEQFLLSLPRLHRPVAFEICATGAQAKWDHDKARALLKAREDLSGAIVGWTDPFTVAQFVAHQYDAAMLQRQLLAHYPNSAVTMEKDLDGHNLDPGFGMKNGDGLGACLALEGAYCFPIRTFTRLDPDPLGVVLAAMDHLGREEWALLQILFQPAYRPWADTVSNAIVNPYKPGEYFFDDLDDRILKTKFGSPLFAVSVNLLAKSRTVFRQLSGWAEQFSQRPQRFVPNQSEWEGNEMPEHEREVFSRSALARCTHRPGMLLNVQELASLVHLPGESVVSQRLKRIKSRTRPVVTTVTERGSVLLGENIHQGKRRLARISASLRSRHCYVAGASGTGKSTLLLNMICQDIHAGEGVGVLDPHGDLVHAVMERIPNHRIDDVILFDPADEDYPFALNILEAKDEKERERIVVETVMALERFFPASWGPRLERILTFAIHTVLHAVPGATLADVERMLTDEKYRKGVLARTKDARFLSFWETQFKFFPKNAVDPVLNKLSVFLLNRTVRNIICQRHAAVDFDQVLNQGKILLANLSTGLLTEKVAGMFGSFLVTKIVNAAFRRARLPEDKRRPWYLYVDEFQAFMNLSVGFDRILAEARKYKLILAGLANQYVGQLSPPVRQAVFGNVGSFCVFRLGIDDAQIVAKELGVFTAEEILNLELGQAIARTGGSATAFNLTTYPEPPASSTRPAEKIVALNRRQYARARSEVEKEMEIVLGNTDRMEHTPGEEPSDPDEDELVN